MINYIYACIFSTKMHPLWVTVMFLFALNQVDSTWIKLEPNSHTSKFLLKFYKLQFYEISIKTKKHNKLETS